MLASFPATVAAPRLPRRTLPTLRVEASRANFLHETDCDLHERERRETETERPQEPQRQQHQRERHHDTRRKCEPVYGEVTHEGADDAPRPVAGDAHLRRNVVGEIS